MAKLNGFNVNVGEKVRECSQCGEIFSNYLSTCPECGGSKYDIKILTPEMEREL